MRLTRELTDERDGVRKPGVARNGLLCDNIGRQLYILVARVPLARIRFTGMGITISHVNACRWFLTVEAEVRMRIRRPQHDEHDGEQAAKQMIAGGADHGPEYAEVILHEREFRPVRRGILETTHV